MDTPWTGAGPAGRPRKRKKRKLPKTITASEADALLRAADDGTQQGVRDRALMEVLYRAGLRVSEVTRIQLRDIDRDGVIRIYEAKGGDGTAYFDPARVLPQLDRWLVVREQWIGELEAPLFCKRDGGPVSVRYIQRLIKRLKDKVGIRGICTPHVLRHTFATELIEEGVPIHMVQSAMRHANLATTAVYLHVRDESLRRAISGRS